MSPAVPPPVPLPAPVPLGPAVPLPVVAVDPPPDPEPLDPELPTVLLDEPEFGLFDSLARIWSAWVMKFCQMIAGYVPPSTGAPL